MDILPNPIDEIDLTEWKRKRKRTFISFCIIACCLGTEYSIIIPSLWFYIHDVIQAPDAKTMYGVTLAVYYISAILGSFTITWVADRTRNIRLSMLLLLACEVIGNIVYSIPLSPYFPLLGRLVQGLGDVNMSIMTAEVARCYPTDEISVKISTMVTCFSITFVIAPAMNVAFKYIDVDIHGYRINYGNLPGLFMAVCFLIVLITTSLLVSNLSKEYDLKEATIARQQYENGALTAHDESSRILNKNIPMYNKGFKNDEVAELLVGRWVNGTFKIDVKESREQSKKKSKLLGDENMEIRDAAVDDDSNTSQILPQTYIRTTNENSVARQLFRNFDFVFLILAGFLMSFSIVAFLDVATPIFGKEYFNFSSRDTGLLFLATGMLFIFVVNVTKVLSKKILEHTFLIVGFIIFITSTCLLLIVSILRKNNFYVGLTLFVSYVLLLGVCWCIEQVFIRSILTKIVPSAYQAFGEGVRRATSSLACIIASVCAPLILNHLCYVCVVVIGISVLVIVVLYLRRHTLRNPSTN